MLVTRVVKYLQTQLKCVEIRSKAAREYRKFKAPESSEFFYVTDSMLFIGPKFTQCRPAHSVLQHASEQN
jgi:hypothetical protein